MLESIKSKKRGFAYHSKAFINSEDGRSIRILSEYLEPLLRLRRAGIRDTIVFFGSARLDSKGPLKSYYDDARKLACKLAQWSLTLPKSKRYIICTGGGGGIMEAANRGAFDAGVSNIGLNIGLPHEQEPNPYITRALHFEFHYFFMRKLWFSHLARAVIVFPGGFGTLDELMEFLTLVQTKKIARPITILLYGTAYWSEIINFGALVRHGMISSADLDLFQYVDCPETAFDYLKTTLGASANL